MGQIRRERKRVDHRRQSAAIKSDRSHRHGYSRSASETERPRNRGQGSANSRSRRGGSENVGCRAGVSKAVAPRGDVHPDADRHLRNHWGIDHTGAILPGVVGAIALILALYLAAILPVNVTGLLLIGLALLLFIFDVFATTHGVLTVAGLVSFLIGSLMLFNRADPLFRLSLNYIIPATIVTAAFFVLIVGKGLRAQLLPVKAGKETLIGKTVPALTPIDARGGRVFVEGEYWNAVSDAPIEKGQLVEISAVEGLTLKVKGRSA